MCRGCERERERGCAGHCVPCNASSPACTASLVACLAAPTRPPPLPFIIGALLAQPMLCDVLKMRMKPALKIAGIDTSVYCVRRRVRVVSVRFYSLRACFCICVVGVLTKNATQNRHQGDERRDCLRVEQFSSNRGDPASDE